MAKINKTDIYPLKENINFQDYLIGTDGESNNKETVSFKIFTLLDYLSKNLTALNIIKGASFKPNYQADKNKIKWNDFNLIHFGIDWQVQGGTFTVPNDLSYIVYIKCSRTDNQATIDLSTENKQPIQDDYYYFTLGVLNSPEVGLNSRTLSLLQGITTIPGEYIKTGRISSNDGSTYFDLDTGEISGKITFTSDSPALNQIDERIKEIFGDDSLTLYITSIKGDLLDIDDLNTTLVVSVDRYFKDVTDEVTSWQWTRESGLSQEAQDADEIWKIGKTTKDLVLTPADFTADIFEYGHTFICTALFEGNKTINGKITI